MKDKAKRNFPKDWRETNISDYIVFGLCMAMFVIMIPIGLVYWVLHTLDTGVKAFIDIVWGKHERG